MFCSESKTDTPSCLSSTIVLAISSTITGATPSEGSSSRMRSGLPWEEERPGAISGCHRSSADPPGGAWRGDWENGEQLFRRPGRCRPAVRVTSRRLTANIEILQHRQIRKDAAVFGDEAKASARDLEWLQP